MFLESDFFAQFVNVISYFLDEIEKVADHRRIVLRNRTCNFLLNSDQRDIADFSFMVR